ncbi:glycosyltransferase family 2 protein [Candidatus Pacearchaeota archaeon]|nr:glycosyltransferase family 2 protein [Candidatus Pacearchaeota archaeon]
MAKADILIVHLNGEDIIKQCLGSIKKNTKDADIYLLLNNSQDKSENIVRKKFPKVKIYKTDKTIGFAESCNILAKEAKSRYLIFLNNDTIVGKNWLDEMIKTVEKHKNCVACQPKIKSFFHKEDFEYAGAAGGFIDRYGYPFCRGRIFNIIEKDKGQYNDEMRIFWGCGVCLLVNRNFFLKSGGFDEDFFMYAEELDFCWRTNLYSKEIWFAPKSEIYHIGSYTTKQSNLSIKNAKKDYFITRNHLLALIKNYSFIELTKILPLRIFFEIVAAIRFAPIRTLSFAKIFISMPWIYISKFHKKRSFIQKNRKASDNKLKSLISKKSIVVEHFLKGKDKFNEIFN